MLIAWEALLHAYFYLYEQGEQPPHVSYLSFLILVRD